MKENNISEKLHMQFYKCNKLLRRNIFEQKMEHIKAVPYRGQGRILRLLLDTGEMTQKDIVQEMDIRPSTAWEFVDKLERVGFVEKVPNPEDKRGTIIRLTDAGKKEAMSSKWDSSKMTGELFSALTVEEQQQLSILLDKIILSLKQSEATKDEDFEFSFDDDNCGYDSDKGCRNDNVCGCDSDKDCQNNDNTRSNNDGSADRNDGSNDRNDGSADKNEKENKDEKEKKNCDSGKSDKGFGKRVKEDLHEGKRFFKDLFRDIGNKIGKDGKSVDFEVINPDDENSDEQH